jgi:DnaA family protein
MPSLMALLDELDRFSLEQKRAVTLTLLRTMTKSSGERTIDEKADDKPPEPADLLGDPLSIESVSISPESGSPRASTRFK